MDSNETLNGFTGFSGRSSGDFGYAREERDATAVVPFGEDELEEIGVLDRRWAWCEISSLAIRHNVLEARRFTKPGCQLMAVVKSDGYGHGAVQCAKAAINGGATWLGVATVDEGVALRKAGFEEPILILSEPPVATIPLLLTYRIVPAIFNVEFALAYGETADQHGMVGPYHLAVNTGMNRIGVRAEEVMEFLSRVNFHRGLDLTGTFTHFATADALDSIEFELQLRRFNEALQAIRTAGIDPGIVHAANSAAIFRYPEAHFDMVRLGIAMYGCHPCEQTNGVANLKPAMSVKARITDAKTVPMSEGVSYGLHYRSPGSVRICTIPIGYADGLRRNLSGKINVIAGGQYCRQVGNICMDQCMFEVDMRSSAARLRLDPQVGDVVTVIGEEGDAVCTLAEMAYLSGTIDYEIAVGFALRMPRVYVD